MGKIAKQFSSSPWHDHEDIMTRISEIYDALISYIGTAYPTRVRLHDTIDIGANTDLQMKNGIGIRFDSADLTTRNVQAQVSFKRSIALIFTNIVEGIDTDNTARDVTFKKLFEDQLIFLSALKENSIIPETTNFAGDNGVLEVPTDRRSLLMLETIFTVEYFEHC